MNQSVPSNKSAFEEAKKVLPGGVNSPVRAFGGVDVDPVFIASAQGAYVNSIEGKQYIDYVGSWGPMILGHAHPQVVEAIQQAASKGASFGAPTLAETELANRIIAAVPSIEQVRLVSSGTEAAMTAVRLARGFSGRDLIIKMSGCYHGHCDAMLVSAGSGLAEHGMPSSAGVPASIAEQTLIVPFNDLQAVRIAFEKNRGRVAGIIVEPVAANIGVVVPEEGYLQGLRRLCDENDAILIFDEVITGFRVAYGGVQQRYGIAADITCLGKIIGGGLPLAAVGGRRQIMSKLAPLGPVYQAGTLSGNPLATAAANVTLDLLARPGVYEKLEQTSAALEDGLRRSARKAQAAVTINRVGSLLSCFFTEKPVRNFADVQSTNIRQFKTFFSTMLEQGIYLAPSAYEAWFVSLAHTEKEIEKTINVAYYAFCKAQNTR
ncbi:MAG: glutamate-1-semialdehyde 2,1-aminomutase [Planctomycetaceae bacterium]|nr:glutamate-1-semialdehyde 2,1-aminomutase [Planctomycetaceae bacterium]